MNDPFPLIIDGITLIPGCVIRRSQLPHTCEICARPILRMEWHIEYLSRELWSGPRYCRDCAKTALRDRSTS